jgi:hypothetical protein
LFNDNPVYVVGDPMLRLGVLGLVAQYCSDQVGHPNIIPGIADISPNPTQQAALRAQDTSQIYLLISKLLAPSQDHDADTRPEIFHKIVSILSCLIRLRRDLVALGVPHLGLILARLVRALRGCRPELGAKQRAMVMDTQPRWVSQDRSLGGEEARALSRLLESLTVKTTVRLPFGGGGGGGEGFSKAESLGRAFSKHAAYVMKAYVEGMGDVLCVVGLEVRRGMREGLFAVCEMMGVCCRDALMVGGGLDVGGKAVVKAVWKEWEEVRYVGQG